MYLPTEYMENGNVPVFKAIYVIYYRSDRVVWEYTINQIQSTMIVGSEKT